MSDNCQNHSGHTAQMESLTHSQIEINASIREIVKGQHEIRERVATVESSSKSAHHRLDSTEKLTDAIVTLAGEVKDVSKDTKAILERMEKQELRTEKHDERIERLEDAPGMIAIKGWLFVGGFIGTAVLSFLIGKIWA